MFEHFSYLGPLVFVINKLHLVTDITFELLQYIIFKNDTRNIGIIATYNDKYVNTNNMSNNWYTTIDIFARLNCIVDWGLECNSYKAKESDVFEFNISKMHEYIDKINDMYYSFSYEEAFYYLSIIYHKFEVERLDISNEYRFKMLELYSKVCICRNELSSALLRCDEMKKILEVDYSYDRQYSYNYLVAMSQMYVGQDKIALNCAEICLKTAHLMNDSFKIFKATMLKYMALSSGWHNIWVKEEDFCIDESIIETARRYNQLNCLAHMYVYALDNDICLFSQVEDIDDRLVNFQKGIDIATELGNDYFLIEAYKRNIMIASAMGFYNVSSYYYLEKCSPIVIRTNNKMEEAHIYNGLGYNCSAMENFEDANRYYNMALSIFYKLGANENIGETLYNMSVNAILVEDFQYANECITTCLKILNILQKESIGVCHISKLYGIKALCSIRLDMMYNCKIFLKSSKQIINHIIDSNSPEKYLFWGDDIFLYYFVNGLLKFQNEEYTAALENYISAERYASPQKGGSFFTYMQLVPEKVKVLRILQREKEAIEELDKCIKFCDEKGYRFKKNKIKALIKEEEYKKSIFDLSLQNYSHEEIVNLAKEYIVRKNYVYQSKNIEFLSLWQKQLNEKENVSELIKNAVNSFKNNYNMDNFIFIRNENGKPKVMYNDTNTALDSEKIQIIINELNKTRLEFATSKLEQNYTEYSTITEIFGNDEIFSLACVPIYINMQMDSIFIYYINMKENWGSIYNKIIIDKKDFIVHIFLFRQLLDAIVKYEANDKIQDINSKLKEANNQLKQLAVTDMLTGLYNRQGFAEQIHKQLEEALEGGKRLSFTILYNDLDNFKYYNDVFGHVIGDLMLKAFSKVLMEICKDKGYAIRYGGDEFIMILNTTSREKIIEAAESIFMAINNADAFIPLVEEMLNKKITVKEKNRLSCSVGIAFVNNAKTIDDVTDAIKKADETLYYIKRNNKNNYALWEDVKDKL